LNSVEPARTSESTLQRVGVYSLLTNLTLSGLKLGLAAISGSLALAADGIHSLVDVFSSVAVILGLRISTRRSSSFPYGLYKVENVVEVIVALLIFLAGYEILRDAVGPPGPPVRVTPWLIPGVLLAVLIPFLFGRYELQIGRTAGSPSLVADARHSQTDVFSTIIVLVAIIGAYLGVSLDRYAAIAVVGFVVWSGWGLLRDGMRVLLDASLDPETLTQIRDILAQAPAVASVNWITGRNSGRFRFVEAEITLRTRNLERAHQVTEQLEANLRARIPNLDRILIHYEPVERTKERLAIPLADMAGQISPHFGDAPYFAIVDLEQHRFSRQEILPNPHVGLERAKGIRVAEWLIAQKVDRLFLREEIQGKGPDYVFSNAGVQVQQTTVESLEQLLAQEANAT